MDKKKRSIIILIVLLFIVLVATSIATYAYFNARTKYYGNFDVNITSKGVDTLQFIKSGDISILANFRNFDIGTGHNVVGEQTLEVKLETTSEVSSEYCYSMELQLPETSSFVYSNGDVPELLLSVSKYEDNNEIMIIDNLDVTTATGSLPVVEKENITAQKNNSFSKVFKAKLTLVYFPDVDQKINDKKSFSAKLVATRIDC